MNGNLESHLKRGSLFGRYWLSSTQSSGGLLIRTHHVMKGLISYIVYLNKIKVIDRVRTVSRP